MQVLCRNKEYFSAKPLSGGALYLLHSQHCVKSDKIRTETIPFPSKLKFRAIAREFVLGKFLKRPLFVKEGLIFLRILLALSLVNFKKMPLFIYIKATEVSYPTPANLTLFRSGPVKTMQCNWAAVFSYCKRSSLINH